LGGFALVTTAGILAYRVSPADVKAAAKSDAATMKAKKPGDSAPAPSAAGSNATQRSSSSSQQAAFQAQKPVPEPSTTPGGPNPGAGTHVVRVASQLSEADALAAFRELQLKYPNELGWYRPFIVREDLGERGVFYRVHVGPFATAREANEMCGRLKLAGAQCVVRSSQADVIPVVPQAG
jgi:cell division septation protein DedD